MHFTEILQLIALMYHMEKPFKSKNEWNIFGKVKIQEKKNQK